MKKLIKSKYILIFSIFVTLLIITIALCLILNRNNTNEELSSLDMVSKQTEEIQNVDLNEEAQEITNEESQVNEQPTSDIQETSETLNENSNSKQPSIPEIEVAEASTSPGGASKTSRTSSSSAQAPTQSAPTSSSQEETTPSQASAKSISSSDVSAERSKFLSDIKSIAPGLNYVYSKRGQSFWPYRTNEIRVKLNGVTFGTVYYYVETFIESGQEKFKYYIDWDG